jgi:heme exporter protein C
VTKFGKPSIAAEMLWPLLSMGLGFTTFLGYALLQRVQNELLWRERGNPWVKEAIA